MDGIVQNILNRFRERWSSKSFHAIANYAREVDSEIKPLLIQSMVSCDVQLRMENALSVEPEDYREFGSHAVAVAASLIQPEDATVAPSTPASATEMPTTAPGVTQKKAQPSIQATKFLHFQLLEEIARGGMGVVYKARDTKLNRIVALKMIIAGKLASEEERFRFNLEAEAAAKLDHPGITPIYEVGEHDGQLYFAMKLIEGGSLADRLPEYGADPRKAARLVAYIAHAIHHAHQRGTLHRDLKPNNILLDDDGNPLVTDFGLAKLAEQDTDVTKTGVMMGTPGYMPPEQVSSGKNVTTAADVYSLGAILFAVLTGRAPFVGETAMETVMQVVQQEPPTVSSLNSSTPVELDLIVAKCLSRIPDERYDSANAMATDLENWLAGEPISIRAPSVATLAKQWMQRNIRLAATSLMIGVLVAFVATPICLVGFGQVGLPGLIYEQLPSTDRPWLAGLRFGLPKIDQSLGFLFIVLAVFLTSSAGAIAVAWLKPKTMNDAVGIGIISGVALGISLFLLLFGWLIGGAVATSYTSMDLNLLTQLSTEKQDFDPQEMIRWRYPDLENASSEMQVRYVLRRKIIEDSQLMFGIGNVFSAILTSMFFLPVVLTAGYYFRLQQRTGAFHKRLLGHLEFVSVAVLLSLALVWLLVTLFSKLLPHGAFNGPEPSVLAMVFSTALSLLAIAAIWNFKHWSIRAGFIGLTFLFFAWFASQVLVGDRLDQDIQRLLAAQNYRGVAERMDLQTKQGGTWYGSSASAVVMAAFAGDEDYHRELYLKLRKEYVQREELFSSGSSPLYLEVLLLTPESSKHLQELDRLIEFVDKFSTVENYGTHRFQVLALVAYRSGDLDRALELLEQVPIDELERLNREGSVAHHHLDDFKALAIQAMVLFEKGERESAVTQLKSLYAVMQPVRDWASRQQDGFGVGLRLFYSLESILKEAIDVLRDGQDRDQWVENNLSPTTS